MKVYGCISLMLILFLAACGGGTENTDNPQQQPTARSQPPTPTPAIALSFEERITFPAGQVENPIEMVIRRTDTIREMVFTILETEYDLSPTQFTPDDVLLDVIDNTEILNDALIRELGFQVSFSGSDTVDELVASAYQDVAGMISDEIFERTSLYVDVVLVQTYADALTALCESNLGVASIAWLDGVTYAAASALNCGQPALQIARLEGESALGEGEDASSVAESTPEATDEPITIAFDPRDIRTGTPALIIGNDNFSASNVNFIAGRTFCRLGLQDFYSWFVPVLLMEQANLDPLRAPEVIRDYEDITALVDAVAADECTATGISEDLFNALGDVEGVNVVMRTPPFPYGVLMYPLEVQLGVRLSLSDDLVALSQELEASRPLRLLLGQDVLVPVDTESLDALTTFLDATGYDFALLGN